MRVIATLLIALAIVHCTKGRDFKDENNLENVLQEREDTIETESQETRGRGRKSQIINKIKRLLARRNDWIEFQAEDEREVEDEIETESLVGRSVSKPSGYVDVETRDEAIPYEKYACLQPDGSSKERSVKDASLFTHNVLRKIHRAKPLTWDDELAASAQKHANFMAKHKKMVHTAALRYGENLAYKGVSTGDVNFGPSVMVMSWYNELVSPGYDFDANKMGKAGHFTQLVWKDTEKVGCGIAKGKDGKWDKVYYCCQYTPPGNRGGEYINQVLKADKVKATQKTGDIDGGCDFFSKCNKYKRFCSKLGAACAVTCGKV